MIVTIQTAASTATLEATPQATRRDKKALLTLALLLLLGVGSLRRHAQNLRKMICVMILVMGGTIVMLTSSCGGTHSGPGTGGGSSQQTPENYALTITATSGTLQHSTTVTLTVQ